MIVYTLLCFWRSMMLFIGTNLSQSSFTGLIATLFRKNELFGGICLRIGIKRLSNLNKILFIWFLHLSICCCMWFRWDGLSLMTLMFCFRMFFCLHYIKLLLKIITAIINEKLLSLFAKRRQSPCCHLRNLWFILRSWWSI